VVARLERGAGRVMVRRLPYPVDQALELLKPYGEMILVGTQPPVSFFAYPDKPSVTTPPDCRITRLAEIGDDILGALRALAESVDALGVAPAGVAELDRPALPSTGMTLENIGLVLAALMPENAIVVDEAVTSGRGFPVPTATAAPHDWLSSRGGSIGFGLPCAVSAAVACQDRKVICLERDGGGEGAHRSPPLPRADSHGGTPRLAREPRRFHRVRPALRSGRGGRRPGPQGHLPRGRRQRDVRRAVAVDDGARIARRARPGVRQPWLPDPARRADGRRRDGPGAERDPHADGGPAGGRLERHGARPGRGRYPGDRPRRPHRGHAAGPGDQGSQPDRSRDLR